MLLALMILSQLVLPFTVLFAVSIVLLFVFKKTRFFILLICCVLIVVSVFAIAFVPHTEYCNGFNLDDFLSIKKGDSEKKVLNLLSSPLFTSEDNVVIRLTYSTDGALTLHYMLAFIEIDKTTSKVVRVNYSYEMD